MTSPAHRLQDAARELREKAEGATPGEWCQVTGAGVGIAPSPVSSMTLATTHGAHLQQSAADAAYIATLHPGVGLAVAELLERTARLIPTDDHGEPMILAGSTYEAALAVADAVLGSPWGWRPMRR